MVVVTERKAIAQFRREKARKRGGGKVRGESALATIADWGPAEDWEDWADATG